MRTLAALLVFLCTAAAAESTIERVPVRRIALAQAVQGAPALEVRMATEAELERLGMTFPEFTTGFLVSQIIPAAGGAAAAPILNVYAVWALVTLPALYAYEERRQRLVERIMATEAFLDGVRRALERRLARLGLPAEGAGEAPRLSVRVLGYGVNRKPGAMENACMFVDAAIQVEQGAKVLYEDVVYMEPFLRSADAPPPACHYLSDLMRDDGALLQRVRDETAEILAAIVLRRLEGE